MVHAYGPSTWEAKIGGLKPIWYMERGPGQPGLQTTLVFCLFVLKKQNSYMYWVPAKSS